MERLIEPLPMKAGDPRVIVNGHPVKADFRIIPETQYKKLNKAYNEKVERWEKANKENGGSHIQNVSDWGVYIGIACYIIGVAGIGLALVLAFIKD